METKVIVFVAAAIMLIPVGILLGCMFQKMRDVLCFLLVSCTLITSSLDINLVSREHYRGTVRGFEISFVDFFAIMLIVSVIYANWQRHRRWFWPRSLGVLLAYAFFCIVSVLISDPKLWGAFELLKMLRGLITFIALALYIKGEREVRIVVMALAVAMCYEGLLSLYHRYGLGRHRVSGSFNHSNGLSMYCALVGPVLAAVSLSKASSTLRMVTGIGAILAILCAILTISRTGLVAVLIPCFGAVFSGMGLRITPKRLMMAMGFVVIVFALLAKSAETLLSRFLETKQSHIAIKSEYDKADGGRGFYWAVALMMVEDRPWGFGLNNWSYVVTETYFPRFGLRHVPYQGTEDTWGDVGSRGLVRAAPAHGIFPLTLGELGIPGVLLVLVMWGRWFFMGARFLFPRSETLSSRLGVGILFGLGGCFLHSLTEWNFRMTEIYLLAHGLAGALAALYYFRLRELRGLPA